MKRALASIFSFYLLFSSVVLADISPNTPPFALTLQQTRHWTANSEFASALNVSHQPLTRRINAYLNAEQKQLDTRAKVLYAPDGMNNFANYLQTQDKFNLYNFTHWAQIDVLNWFAGTATHTVQIPAKPWVDVAHKNGVKVIGSVFLAVAQWGGNPDTVETFLEQDKQGRFVFAHRLIEIAQYYGFDGWLMNQETNLAAIKDANNDLVKGQSDHKRAEQLGEKMLQFMQYLTAIVPANMEIHWYDAMLKNGQVKWQNEVNQNNRDFLQDDVSSADAMFINYWWNEQMVLDSVEQVKKLNRSPFDVYFGADLWPSRKAQRAFSRTNWIDWLFDPSTKQARSSIALFAPNFNYNFAGESHTPAFSQFNLDPKDHQRFYATEQRLFAGDDLNSARPDTTGWPGIDHYLPAKSVINSLPVITHFNTGQGKAWFVDGIPKSGPWTNMAKQDLLPTWQFAVFDEDKQSTILPFYDFDNVYQGGSSLAITGSSQATKVEIPLFYTALKNQYFQRFEIVIKGAAEQLSIYLVTDNGQTHLFPLEGKQAANAEKKWQIYTGEVALNLAGQVTQIGLLVEPNNTGSVAINIGKLALY